MTGDTQYVKQVMTRLCQQPRCAGTRGAAIARGNLQYWYEAVGYATHLQTAEFTGWELVEPPRVTYEVPIQAPLRDCLPVVWSGSTDGEVVGRVLRDPAIPPEKIKTFEAYEWFRYHIIDENSSVLAYLLTNDRPDKMVWPQSLDDESDQTPYVIVGTAEHHRIENYVRERTEVKVRLSVRSRYLPNQTLANVVAQRGDDTKVIVGAHYDSFFNTVGAHDNASGTAVLLLLAREVAASGFIPEVRFVSFDAEEWNKLGAYKYVEALEQSGELSRVELMINIDSVGVGDSIRILTSPDIQKTVTDVVGKAGFPLRQSSDDIRERRTTGLPSVEITVGDAFPQFDSWPFQQKGIPILQIGTRGSTPFLYWHDPRDTLEVVGEGGYRLIGHVGRLVRSILDYWVH